ncbi:hypothetical protein [Polynucleobacter sp. MWH-Braz-FAM2G]|uniref:hypothetical protein n=1 Tax=Polynucleobacter sp. MWH-Braz-FAM2G TaxID=1855883 RepID=UPI001BFD6053|nr:hypothetical protein [Polynucleobacter sp. MWH-Braz-FAM2G]QWD91963.1 hypothetical protein FD973_01720 [Polynucleobacter sp. MWH-Braz-FAM2G]
MIVHERALKEVGFYNPCMEGNWTQFRLHAVMIIANRNASALLEVNSTMGSQDFSGWTGE